MQFREKAEGDDGWEIISSDVQFENGHLTVVEEEVRSPARERPHRWTVVHRKRSVVIAPFTEGGRLVLIRQERIPIRNLGSAVGAIDNSAEADADEIAVMALRELREETGYQLAAGGELLPLGDFFSSPGFSDERGFFFLAHPVESSAKGHTHQESESILDCRGFTAAEVSAMIAHNEIRDANTLSICAKLVARGLLTLPSSS